MYKADLSRADIVGALLDSTNLTGAKLIKANLSKSNLSYTNLSETQLTDTDFQRTELYHTVFAFTDLSTAKNLETCIHQGPSIIDLSTLTRSGVLPRSFLLGVGLSDLYIDYLPSLLEEPFQFYTCFISYTESDNEFSQKLYYDLQEAGIRCWRWREDLEIGRTMMREIDQAIRTYDKLIIILSKESLKSQPVQDEITRAFQKERNLRKKNPHTEIFFPVRVDNYIFSHHCTYEHAADLKAKRIGDFKNWKDEDSYQIALGLLLKSLK